MPHKEVRYVEVKLLNHAPGIKISPWKNPLTTEEKKMEFEIYNKDNEKETKIRKWAMKVEIDEDGDMVFIAVDPETGYSFGRLFYLDSDAGTLEICHNIDPNLGLKLNSDRSIVVNS